MLENLQSEQLNFTVEDILLKRDMDFINKVNFLLTIMLLMIMVYV